MSPDKLAQLDSKIAEARELLTELERAAQHLREQKQHNTVDKLDELFEESELDFSKFGPFKDEVMEEWRVLVQKVKSYLGL